MTRTFVAAALAALAVSPLAAQSTPSSRYKLGGPNQAASQPATKTKSQPGTAPKPTYGPPAAPKSPRTTTDSNVRPAADTQPIREPGPGQPPPRQPLKGAPPQQPRVDAPPQQPQWFPLDPALQKWVDDVLVEWEAVSSQVHYFECTFHRFEFEPVFGPKDGVTPKSRATGVIKYQQPDKGLLRVEKLEHFVPGPPGEKAKFETPKDEFGEHWVCDGKSIFEFDNRQKKLIQRILPKEMQGTAIADGPLPFLFGAKAAAIKQRYWIRPIRDEEKPRGADNQYWLEAWPKSRQDAANFKFVKIVIAPDDFMPSALGVYGPNFDPKRNAAHIDYLFEDRKATMKGSPKITFQQVKFWEREFFEPKIPFGWKKVVENLGNPPVAAGPPPQARKLKSGVKMK